MKGALLSVNGLSIEFDRNGTAVRAIDDVTFSVGRGERVGLVGESGSGKSVLALAIMGLIRRPGKIVSGSITLDGEDLRGLPGSRMDAIRGKRVALIPQDASLALTPVLRIGDQMREMLRRHLRLGRTEAEARCQETLRRVGLPDPDRIMNAYASELSGGMKQRVAIALALLCDPELLVADDPTSAVDVTIQAQILTELRDLSERLGLSVLFITHDLRVISSVCSRVVVLYAGQIAEMGTPNQILRGARHPYSDALVRCSPSVEQRISPLPTVPGTAGEEVASIPGCRFHPRCPERVARCSTDRPILAVSGDDPNHRFACWNPRP